MKRQMIIMATVVTFFATLAVASVRAQNAGDFSVTIPFEFAAGGKTLPAGDYYIRRNFDHARVVIRLESKSSAESIYLAMHSVQKNNIQDQSKLIFNKYGNQMFLTQVWTAGRSAGEELNKSSHERELQSQIARSRVKQETVTISAKAN
jgi:hypothetical protein